MECNVQKMREALQEFVDCWDNCNYAEMGKQLVEQARAALAEPPRNCDVGNAEEQNYRHGLYCSKHDVNGDMEADCANNACSLCILKWCQMPYD